MHFDQDRKPQRMGKRLKADRRPIVEGRHDQEDGIGPDCTRLDYLIGVEGEILAQDGPFRGGTGGDEVVRVALKIGAVGQD